MKRADFSTLPDPENRSKKLCVCGGHSAADVKKNRNHHATQVKLQRRAIRRLVGTK